MSTRQIAATIALFCACTAAAGATFEVSFSEDAQREPVDGRVIVIISPADSGEPRFRVGWGVSSAQVFGVEVDGWRPGRPVVVDEAILGHPLRSLSEVPPGNYRVQAVLNVYETFERADGHTVKMPADNGEGQDWSTSPGNLFSEPMDVEITAGARIHIDLTEKIPPIEPPLDTKYIRHVRIRSEKLSAFWGQPMYLGAIVLLPEGFDEDGDTRYPVLYNQATSRHRFAFLANSRRRRKCAAAGAGRRRPATSSSSIGPRGVCPRCWSC